MSHTNASPRFRLMDCNCRIGPFESMEPANITTLDGLLAEMARLGVADALVMHTWSSQWSPALGNQKIDQDIDGHGNLFPCYVGLPGATGELAPPAEFAAQVRARRGAVRLFPKRQSWAFTEWGAADLLEALDAEAVPVLISLAETDWNELARVLARYHRMPLILLETSYRIDRTIYPLLERHPNLYLESNTFQIPWGIEDIARRFGAGRLIFGTGLPESEGGGALAQVAYNDLSDAETALIAGGNLRRLLGIAANQDGDADSDSTREDMRDLASTTDLDRLRSGIRLRDALVIDDHGHMGPWLDFHIPGDGSPESMVANMDLMGIDMIVASPHIAIGPDMHEGNRQIVEAALKFPDRILPYITINPRYPLADIEAEIARCHDLLGGIKGFKFHSSLHGTDCAHAGYGPAYEYADAHGIPILSHVWNGPAEGGKSFLFRQAAAYPNIAFIHAHAGNSWPVIRQMVAEAKRSPNVYLDLAGSGRPFGGLEYMVEELGAERILLGTDLPFIDVRCQFGRVLAAEISDADRRLIMGLNAKRLFKL